MNSKGFVGENEPLFSPLDQPEQTPDTSDHSTDEHTDNADSIGPAGFSQHDKSMVTKLLSGPSTVSEVSQLYHLTPNLAQDDWSKLEIEKLFSIVLHDLTSKGIGSLASKTTEQVLEAAGKFPIIPWTSGEISLIKLANQEDTKALNLLFYLPYRLQESIERARAAFLSAPSSEDYYNINSEFNKKLIVQCMESDLSLDALVSTFQNIPFDQIVEKIRLLGDLDCGELTVGEKHTLKNCISNGQSIGHIYLSLPCRSRSYVGSKYKEMEYVSSRKTKFKSHEERLIYEAKWVMFTSGESSTRRARKRHSDQDIEQLEQDLIQNKSKPKEKVELTPEQIAERELRKEKRKQMLLEKQEQKRIQRKVLRELLEQRRLQGLTRPRRDVQNSSLKSLLAGSQHFQSVIGDKKVVEQGQKRKRIQADHYRPEIEIKKTLLKTRPRQAHKIAIKKALKLTHGESTKKLVKKLEKPKKPKLMKGEQIDNFSSSETPIKTEDEEDDQEDYVSPFDPTDINSDTLVPLNGRELFESGFYSSQTITNINYVNGDGTGESSHLIMTSLDDSILAEDDLAVHIVQNHSKNYRSLPISFPPMECSESSEEFAESFNRLRNIVRVRFLVHPQHSELFLLAAPKSNELDPIYEIIKLFMIHYTLYFSHSPVLKKIITEDYCETLERSVEENDFGMFMSVIDKWNLLMLELSPNSEELVQILTDKDLNPEVREFLGKEEVKRPTLHELKLAVFFEEITKEYPSPLFQIVRGGSNSHTNEEMTRDGVHIPVSVTREETPIKPKEYNAAFFSRLLEMTSISRFTMQQILLRVYSRIVSTDSKKLRSYKAFTAEVYGELLPSFTSEVLEKVLLTPNQNFYDLGSGVGNTTFQAALEFGARISGGCELMDHASKLTKLQEGLIQKHLKVLGLKQLELDFALLQSFVANENVRQSVLNSDVLIINNYLFDVNLNTDVGRLLHGLKAGTKIISLRNFIRPRYKATGDTIFDRLTVEEHEMSDFLSVSWTANKVPYFISTVQENIVPEYLGRDDSPENCGSVKVEYNELAQLAN
ncbi:DOT1-domain-containing protein [Suhomyces tanzawaensis NRRL Y-17324]|uniref:Histone-lysine N-methyltransferase, H3 lysine-79 specific n=1 Tax=Suhomyces tanzawaensis NRRL Y-17324 TaxID=984487 RepID=A0A1E4SII5_9ASCO|nr:DOT1-domain-containing protein [Suhomyces tanzawaensis NRRL Y-17324]ODV79300.1 DOT1-domain-containing protein [Suhomyces tanzawaensis NRRL Y-17324]